MRRQWYYILEGHEPVPVDVSTWGRWMETANRRVAHDQVAEIAVSTVFLGFDHNYEAKRPPLLFETLVFSGVYAGEMERYATWAEAEAGHARMLQKVRLAHSAGFGDS